MMKQKINNPFKLKQKHKVVSIWKPMKPTYKRTVREQKLIRTNPWGDRDRDLVPNWIDCKPFDKRRQGEAERKIIAELGPELKRKKQFDKEFIQGIKTQKVWKKYIKKYGEKEAEERFSIYSEVPKIQKQLSKAYKIEQAEKLGIDDNIFRQEGKLRIPFKSSKPIYRTIGAEALRDLIQTKKIKGRYDETSFSKYPFSQTLGSRPHVMMKVASQGLKLKEVVYKNPYYEDEAEVTSSEAIPAENILAFDIGKYESESYPYEYQKLKRFAIEQDIPINVDVPLNELEEEKSLVKPEVLQSLDENHNMIPDEYETDDDDDEDEED